MPPKKRGLGRGLDALLRIDTANPEEVGTESLRSLDIDALKPGRFQPRRTIDAQTLSELAASIRAQGMIQPIVVRATGDRQFEIIAGERRWRAAREAGLREVPCVVRDADDRATIAMALIENIQREDLAPLEEASALQRLIDEFELTHQKAADAVGRSRAAVSNLLRLLELPAGVRQRLESQLVCGIRRVGDELAQKDLLVAVQGVNHQVQQLCDLGLEAERFARVGGGHDA